MAFFYFYGENKTNEKERSNWMKHSVKLAFVSAAFAATLLAQPVKAMENRVESFQLEQGALHFTLEELEQRLGLREGDLLALTVLLPPEKGQLLISGVVVEQGDTLLRRELEELYYVPAKGEEDDWFAVLPVCSQDLCAVFNLKA